MMKPISTEDDLAYHLSGITMDKKRILGITAVLIALLLNSFISILITGLSVSDSNPTTYIIIVMLMLFLFTVFYLKDKTIIPNPNPKNMAYGTGLLVLYVVAVSYLRVSMSYLFILYRIDALLLPLFLFAVIVAAFGFEGAKKMQFLLIYALFASPIILLPVLRMDSQFALFNSYIIYDLSRAAGLPLIQNGIVLSAPASNSISISSTCADLGAFIAFIMLIAPLTYLYSGSAARKFIWSACGVALLFVLNLFRMFFIVLIWAYYGITNAISSFHLFAGEALFISAIIIMVVLAYKFGLSMPKVNRENSNLTKTASNQGMLYLFILLPALIFGIAGLVLSTPYTQSLHLNLNETGSQMPSYVMLDRYVLSTLENARSNVLQLQGIGLSDNANNLSFALGNSTDPLLQTYVLVNYTQSPIATKIKIANVTLDEVLVLTNGVTLHSSVVRSRGYEFVVNYFSLPYNSSGSLGNLDYEFVGLLNATSQCKPKAINSAGTVNYFESAINNAVHGMGTGDAVMCQAYLVASSMHN